MKYTFLLTLLSIRLAFAGGTSGVATFANPQTIYAGPTSTVQWGDINNDGLDDMFVAEGGRHSGGEGSKILAWFEAPNWIRHDIAPTLGPFTGDSDLVDVDGDTDLDIVISTDSHSVSSAVDAVYWYENTGDFTLDWPQHTIELNVPDAFHIGDMETGDVDGDGKLDVVVRHLSTLRFVVYFQNSADDWQPLRLNTRHREGLAVADLDQNGRADIIGNGYILFAPNNPRNETWTEKTFDNAYYNVSQTGLNNSVKTEIADMDNDNRLDIIMSSAEGQAVYLAWYKNPFDAQNGTWNRTIIESPQGKNHQVQIADIDLDGDVDIYGGFAFGASGVYWWENVNGLATAWQRHTIVSNLGCYSCLAIDFDNDGDIDFAGPQTYTGQVNLFENTTALDTLLIDLTQITFPNIGGDQLISVVADINWTVVSNQPWLSVTPDFGNNDGNVTVSASVHVGFGERQGTVTFSGGSITRQIAVTQEGMVDLTAPGAPENLAADNTDHNSTELNWDPSTDNSGTVSGYKIYQDGIVINSSLNPDTDIIVLGLQADSSYAFSVTALDASDNESALSDEVTILTNMAPLAPQPIAHWNLNESSGLIALDSQGFNDGNLINFIGTQWVPGILNNALNFDGIDDRVDLGTMDIGASTLTISAWINAADFSTHAEGRIISKADGGSSAQHFWMLSTIQSGSETRLRFRLKTNGTTSTQIATSGALITGMWTHVVATYDGSEMKLFKDAILVGSQAKTGGIDNSNAPISIGDQPQDDGNRPFAGIIDDLCIFDQALALTQIEDLYRSGNGLSCGFVDFSDIIFKNNFENN